MSTQNDTTPPPSASLLRRRMGIAMIIVGIGAIIPAFASADDSFAGCPGGSYLSWTETYDPAVSVIQIDNFPILYVGLGTSPGTHVLYGNGTPLNNTTIDVLAATGGQPASDAHFCKQDETTTTTVPDTTTTTTVPDTTTTTLVGQESGTTTTTVTSIPSDTTTTVVDQNAGTTTTLATRLPRTGSDAASSLTAFGGLLILLGGLMLHSTRRIEAID